MQSTSTRLRQIMQERGMKQVDLLEACKPYCEKFGVKLDKSHLSQYVNGVATPHQSKLFILGQALGISEAWLMGYDVPMDKGAGSGAFGMPDFHAVPRYGTIACGAPILAEQNIEGYDNVPDWVHCDFTLICRGDSMTGARIYDGDVVCIRQQDEVESGQIAAVLVDDETESGSATLKRVRIVDGGIILMPENPAYEPQFYLGADAQRVHILGLATHFISTVH